MAQPVSASWLPALQKAPLRLCCWAEVWSGVGGTWLGSLPVTGGTVTDDQTNAVRRTCSNVTMPNPKGVLAPTGAAGLLEPAGNELQLYKGLCYSGSAARSWLAAVQSGPYDPNVAASVGFEAVPLGRFLLERNSLVHNPGDNTVRLSGSDRGQTVDRAALTQPWSSAGTETLDQLIEELINNAVPGLAYNFAPQSSVPAVVTYDIGAKPFTQALALANSGGLVLFPDASGTMVLKARPDPASSPVTYSYGPGAVQVLTALTVDLSNVNVPNWIIYLSSGSGVPTPLRADWQDTDPASPTYINGKYPRTVATVSTSAITDLPTLQAAANAAGLQNKGLFNQASFSIIDNAAQAAGDVVSLVDPETGASGRYLVDRLTHTLGHSTALSGQGRLVA